MFCFVSVRDRKWCNSWPGWESKWIKVKETNGSSLRWRQSSSIPKALWVKWYSIIWQFWGRLCSKVCYFISHCKFEVIPDTLCTTRVSYCHGVTNTHIKLFTVLKDAGHSKGDCHHLVEAELLLKCFSMLHLWYSALESALVFHSFLPTPLRNKSLLGVETF